MKLEKSFGFELECYQSANQGYDRVSQATGVAIAQSNMYGERNNHCQLPIGKFRIAAVQDGLITHWATSRY